MAKKNNNNSGKAHRRISASIVKKLCELIPKVLYIETACQIAGIDKKTYYNWRDRAEKGQNGYAEYFHDIKKAEALAEQALIKKIQDAADSGTWTAAAWLLERRYPDKWGRRERIQAEHTGDIKLIVEWAEGDGKPD